MCDILPGGLSSGHKVRRISEDIAEVPSINLLGTFATSPNRRFTLVWSDADPSGGRGGYRESGHGRYVLLDSETIVAQGRLERPNDGHVIDCGRFILSDWMFGEGLRSEFYVFDAMGTALVHARFSANQFSSGIAPDGSYAACQLCNSGTSDGGMLAIFDMTRRARFAQFAPATGWAQEYRFDASEQKIGLTYPERGTFWYRFDGTLLDREAWTAAQIGFGTGFQILEVAREALRAAHRPISKSDADDILKLAMTASERLVQWPREQAKAERFCGEVAEAVGDNEQAIMRYERALSLDGKIGVKRRLEALRQAILHR